MPKNPEYDPNWPDPSEPKPEKKKRLYLKEEEPKPKKVARTFAQVTERDRQGKE